MVVSLFKHIKKKNINLPTWTDPIYKKEQLATKTIVVPVKDIRQLIVNFLLEDQQPFYKAMVNIFLLSYKNSVKFNIFCFNDNISLLVI